MTIEKLQALEAKATPGPWEHRQVDGLNDIATSTGWIDDCSDNFALIADMRNALPALLEVAKAAKHAAEYFGSKDLSDAIAKLEATK